MWKSTKKEYDRIWRGKNNHKGTTTYRSVLNVIYLPDNSGGKTMHMNNPAGRLHNLISSAKEYFKKGSNVNIYDGWVKVLDYKTEMVEDLQVMRSIALIAQLPEEVRRLMVNIDMDSKPYTVWINSTTKKLKIRNLDVPMMTILESFDENKMGLIAICDETLNRVVPEPYVNKEKIDEIKTELEAIIQNISSDEELPDYLRSFMLKHLDIVHHACCDYRITGMSGILETVNWSVGHVIMNRGVCEETVKTDVGSKFFSVLGRLIMLLQVYEKFKTIGNDIMAFLPESGKGG